MRHLAAATFTSFLFGVGLPAQVSVASPTPSGDDVVEVTAPGVDVAAIDMDLAGPPGPITVAAMNAAATNLGSTLRGLVVQPRSGVPRDTYDSHVAGGRALACDSGLGGPVLIDAGKGTYEPFDLVLELGGPSMALGLELGDYAGSVDLVFRRAGVEVGRHASSPFAAATVK